MQKSLLVCLVLFGTASAVSPVGKVIELLDDLKGKVQNDLAKEGAAMEEYSEWCETEQSDNTYAIKTATSKIADLSAAMADGEAQASAFATQISELGSTIASKETELAEAADMRKTDRANFESTEKELLDTVDELSRGVMKVKQGAALLQQAGSREAAARLQTAKSLADVLSKIVEAAWVDQAGKRRLTKFIQASEGDDLSLSQPQANVKSYESHSGGIVGTLTDMQEKAEGTLSDARKNEMKGQHSYALVKMGIEEEIKLLKKKLGDATAGKSGAEQALAAAAGEKAEVEKTKAADEKYLQTVTLDCKTKADEWAARQKSATEELAAVDKAKEILSSGVKVFVQVGAKAHSMVKNDDDDDLAQTKTRMRVVEQLKNMGRQFNSFRLVQLASSASQDPFGKVRGLTLRCVVHYTREFVERVAIVRALLIVERVEMVGTLPGEQLMHSSVRGHGPLEWDLHVQGEEAGTAWSWRWIPPFFPSFLHLHMDTRLARGLLFTKLVELRRFSLTIIVFAVEDRRPGDARLAYYIFCTFSTGELGPRRSPATEEH